MRFPESSICFLMAALTWTGVATPISSRIFPRSFLWLGLPAAGPAGDGAMGIALETVVALDNVGGGAFFGSTGPRKKSSREICRRGEIIGRPENASQEQRPGVRKLFRETHSARSYPLLYRRLEGACLY